MMKIALPLLLIALLMDSAYNGPGWFLFCRVLRARSRQ